jgi:hypothetical protein
MGQLKVSTLQCPHHWIQWPNCGIQWQRAQKLPEKACLYKLLGLYLMWISTNNVAFEILKSASSRREVSYGRRSGSFNGECNTQRSFHFQCLPLVFCHRIVKSQNRRVSSGKDLCLARLGIHAVTKAVRLCFLASRVSTILACHPKTHRPSCRHSELNV